MSEEDKVDAAVNQAETLSDLVGDIVGNMIADAIKDIIPSIGQIMKNAVTGITGRIKEKVF